MNYFLVAATQLKRGHTHADHVEYQPNFVYFGTGSINITTVCGYERAECMRVFK